MVKTKYRIYIDGQPQRLYVNSGTKKREAEGDPKYCNTFGKSEDAEKRAQQWGLTNFAIQPVVVDEGEVTHLTEVGF